MISTRISKLASIAAGLLLVLSASASIITVAFDAPTDITNVAGYNIVNATNPVVIYSHVDGATSTNNIVVICPYGTRIAAQSVGNDGSLSDLSNVITNTVLDKPNNLRKR